MGTENEAIQQDVSLDSGRMDAINRIAERQRQEREGDDNYQPVDEIVHDVAPEQEEEEQLEDETIVDEQNDDAQESGENEGEDKEPEPPVYLKDGVWMTRKKIDGQEQEVPFDKVLATAQKNEAADARLYEASQRLREAELREQQIAEREAQLSQQNQLPAEGVDNQGDRLEELYQKQHEALMEGDDELYRSISKELADEQRRIATSSIDRNEIVQQATQKMLEAERTRQQEQYQKQVNEANQAFREKHSDLVSDPALFALTHQFSTEVLNEEPNYTPLQNLEEAAKRTREWLKEKQQAGFKEERQNRKKLSSTTGGSNARANVGKDAPPPKTRSQTIKDIAAQRGQSI